MTAVQISLRDFTRDGARLPPNRGRVLWRTRRLTIQGEVVLSKAFPVELTPDEDPIVQVLPGPWHIAENLPGGINRTVLVPDTDGLVFYGDLPDIDPDTLDPDAEPEAAWWAALAGISAGAIDPAVVDAAVEAAFAGHVESPTPHPAYDVDIPSLVTLFENGIA